MVTAAMKLIDACSSEEDFDQSRQHIKKQTFVTLPTKVHLVKAMVFPVVMYGCESGTIRNLSTKKLMVLNCGVGEDSCPLDSKEIKPVHPKGNQS